MMAKKSLPARAYRMVADAVEPLLPKGLVTPSHYFARRITRRLEPECAILLSMIRPGMTAVDAGANLGVYTFALLARGANVVAFEPQASLGELIRAFYRIGFPRSGHRGTLDVRTEALGAANGDATLHVPLKNGKIDHESASLESASRESMEVTIPVRRLDDLDLGPVDALKVDVEGHELALFEGAVETIRRWKPVILVEVEQRHHIEPIDEVFARIKAMTGPEYRILFLRDGNGLRPLEEFDVQKDQIALAENPLSPSYVRNFFILPKPVAK
jgi:FkbM family methyltransferase